MSLGELGGGNDDMGTDVRVGLGEVTLETERLYEVRARFRLAE